MEAVIAVAVVLHQFDVQLTLGQEIGMTTGATIHTTNGLYMNVSARQQQAHAKTETAEAVTANAWGSDAAMLSRKLKVLLAFQSCKYCVRYAALLLRLSGYVSPEEAIAPVHEYDVVCDVHFDPSGAMNKRQMTQWL